jgi:hypothetical protein
MIDGEEEHDFPLAGWKLERMHRDHKDHRAELYDRGKTRAEILPEMPPVRG